MIIFYISFIFSCPFTPQRKPFTSVNHSPWTHGIIYSCDSKAYSLSYCFCSLGFHDTLLYSFFISSFFNQPPNVRNVLIHPFLPLYLPLDITFTPRVSWPSSVSQVLSTSSRMASDLALGSVLSLITRIVSHELPGCASPFPSPVHLLLSQSCPFTLVWRLDISTAVLEKKVWLEWSQEIVGGKVVKKHMKTIFSQRLL